MPNISTTNTGRGLLIAVACVFLSPALIAMSNTATARDINVKDMITAKGECRMELVKGAGYNPCNEGVIYMLFKNGRHLLMFSNKDGTVIAVAGAGDRQPRLEDYYVNVDTLRTNIPGRKEAVDTNMEGECHIRVAKEKVDFRRIECDVYDRAKGLSFSARVDNIVDTTHRHFD
jgi:hypothetical protein